MAEINTETSLKNIINKENAASEEVKQNEIAALRQLIEDKKYEIERLKAICRRKNRNITILGILLGLFIAICIAMIINFMTYQPVTTSLQQSETSAISTQTITETENTQQNKEKIILQTPQTNNESNVSIPKEDEKVNKMIEIIEKQTQNTDNDNNSASDNDSITTQSPTN